MLSRLYHAAPIAAVASCDRSSRVRPAARTAAHLATPATTAALALHASRRTFFSQAPSGADLLRRLASSAGEPAKAVSPLESLRPPAPPSASDAQPFGSLNRHNSIRRYVNVNAPAAGGETVTPTVAAAASPPPTPNTSGSSFSGTASAPPSSSSPPPRMDLHRLVRRHHGSPAHHTNTSSAPHEDVAPAPTATGSATVAKAQAAIAAAAAAAAATRSAQAMASASPSSTTGPAVASASSHGAAGRAASAPTHGDHGAPGNNTGSSSSSAGATPRHPSQVYKEHCTIGWSPDDFHRVVADVAHYAAFLPWCAGSEVHTTRRVRVPRGARRLSAPTSAAAAGTRAASASVTNGNNSSSSISTDADAGEAELVDAIEMTATLTIGFSFLKEQYTSLVTVYPDRKIVAVLYDDEEEHHSAATTAAAPARGRARAGASLGKGIRGSSSSSSSNGGSVVLSFFKKAASTAGAVARRSILKNLVCEWEFIAVPGKPNAVEVLFSVSFEFKNPIHAHMIMSNVVTLMTRSFERRCESLYGPPSATKEALPLVS